ncbi:MAG: spermidine/putrescine ABC transporter substrate-binding protein [Meiothermus sp.]|uniref:polyamine ABC transporter substrate-binding protein n=1 Tax=Meiothermus sp. TaxID=1955249 RepID=UPI0025E3A704|nr:spermidine/putrescine ABC transporter substrate-binding protein [Meiothermus sp.]MCS7067330.1 spermidine/putrescine ABC transporter substrate-binding protein [Meiothermus sp.]MDW8424590.1 spermidine/putrescine ABC transporter substrate-binding protein [Meiothermus sp.]
MHRVWLIALLVLLVAGCGQQKKELRLLNWSDYMPREVLEEFEKREGIKVVEDTYDSPEAMLSKLQAGGDSEFDLLITPDYTVGSLARAGSLQELDKTQIPNLKNLDPQFADPAFDPGGKYSVVYQWGTTGLAYREDLVSGPVESWAVLFDPQKQVGRFLLLDEMREMMGAALKFKGESVNTTDAAKLAEVQALLLEAKRRSLGFAGGTSIRDRLISGDIAVGPAYSGDILAAQPENPKLKYVIPVEGATLWTDNLVILKKSPNQELAYRFINFLLEPEIAAQVSNSIGYATPVAAAMDRIEEKDNPLIYPTEEKRARLELLADLGDQADAYNKVWSEVKSR